MSRFLCFHGPSKFCGRDLQCETICFKRPLSSLVSQTLHAAAGLDDGTLLGILLAGAAVTDEAETVDNKGGALAGKHHEELPQTTAEKERLEEEDWQDYDQQPGRLVAEYAIRLLHAIVSMSKARSYVLGQARTFLEV